MKSNNNDELVPLDFLSDGARAKFERVLPFFIKKLLVAFLKRARKSLVCIAGILTILNGLMPCKTQWWKKTVN